MRTILAIIFTLLPLLAFPQSEMSNNTWQDLYNQLSDLDDFDEEGWTEAYDILTSLAQSPQNINEATYQDLHQVPLLTEQQALAILNYRSLYGDLHSMSELSLITALDRPRIMLLKAVFYAQPTNTKASTLSGITPNDSILQANRNAYQYTKNSPTNSLLFTINIPTYERAGYKDGTYRGYGLSHSLRYRYNKKRIQIGFTAAQDAGEPFFSGTNKKGWDFYTGFLRLKNMGIMQNLVVGHYQMSIGMGLLMNTDYRLSRTSLLITSPQSTVTLRGHSSRQQSNYLQGAAATIAIPIHGKKNILAFTPYISYRSIDATMSNTEPATITTILTNGYHRTDSEIARRNTAKMLTAGASLTLALLPFRVALNVLHISLSDSLLPDKTKLYNQYRPTGKQFTSASLSYGYLNSRLSLTGETAVSQSAKYKPTDTNGMAFATANNIRYKISETWTAFALQRFYGYKYQSLMGKSFGDMSNCQDESGVYVGATTTALKRITLSAYVDCAYHTWPRYGYQDASRSWDTYLLATYTRNNITATLRYRYREQALAPDANIFPAYNGSLDGSAQHTLRATLKYVKAHLTSISQLQGTYLPSSSDWGFLASEAIGYSIKPLNLWCSLTYFNTNEYASRLYLTDRNVAYGQTTNMLYGCGLRANIMLQTSITKHISAAMRCNMLQYFDRSQISSAHQLIDSSNQTDLQFQLSLQL